MQTKYKILSWIPLVGILIESYYAYSGQEAYLADHKNNWMFYGSLVYHSICALLVVAYITIFIYLR
jgi:hypothetical protein